jgi:methylenetetrahydrofolate dehydrogenase (NADP+)/methenyltetrahydrofolate cyclohydrolase
MLKPGATVVDVGTTVVDGRIVGDVDATSAAGVAGVVTPVPGGVGPVTNAVLMEHVMLAARNLAAAERARRPTGRSGRIAPASPGTGLRRR